MIADGPKRFKRANRAPGAVDLRGGGDALGNAQAEGARARPNRRSPTTEQARRVA